MADPDREIREAVQSVVDEALADLPPHDTSKVATVCVSATVAAACALRRVLQRDQGEEVGQLVSAALVAVKVLRAEADEYDHAPLVVRQRAVGLREIADRVDAAVAAARQQP